MINNPMDYNSAVQYVKDIGYELIEYSHRPYTDDDYTYKEVHCEVWDDALDGMPARYECSRCGHINTASLNSGSAGECEFCEEVDYWDLQSIKIEDEYLDATVAFKILKSKGLIRIQKTKEKAGLKPTAP
jgi:hypothetical protein